MCIYMRCLKERWKAVGKKVVKTVGSISAACMLLSGSMAISAYAAEGPHGSTGGEAGQEGTTTVGEQTESSRLATRSSAALPKAEDIEEAESAPVRLQVPMEFDIVLDPFEMDERGQIYSGEYRMTNTGKESGTLRLTGIAVGVGETVDVRPDDNGIHDGDSKNLFIEMVMNGEDRLTLLPDGADYEVMLEVGAEMTLTFTGEMNENAGERWCDSDVEVTVIYDWATESEEDAEEMSEVPEEEKDEEEIPEGADKEMTAEEIGKTEISGTTSEEKDPFGADAPDIDGGEAGKASGIDTPDPGGEAEIPPSLSMPEDNGGIEETPDTGTSEEKEEAEKTPGAGAPEDSRGAEESLDSGISEDGGELEKNPATDTPEDSEGKGGASPDMDTSKGNDAEEKDPGIGTGDAGKEG